MSNNYKIFTEKQKDYLAALLKMSEKKKQTTIFSPFDLKDIPNEEVKEYLASLQ